MSILSLKQPTPHTNVLHETPEYTTKTIVIVIKRQYISIDQSIKNYRYTMWLLFCKLIRQTCSVLWCI